MQEKEMGGPILRLFLREYPAEINQHRLEAYRYFPYSDERDHTRADMLYLQGRAHRRTPWVHAVEFEPTIRRAMYDSNHGVFELKEYPANYQWLELASR